MSKSVTDVEEILREIRLRVQHENLERTQKARRASEKFLPDVPPQRESLEGLEALELIEHQDAGDALDMSYLQARLTILDKTRNNLPPVVSRRGGLAARAELFVKRQIRRMTKWFVWDQLTFNTTVYETLLELQKLQTASVQEQVRLRELLVSNTRGQAQLRESLVSIAEEQAWLREAVVRTDKHRSETLAEVEGLRND